jgi:hypothetical protein
LAVLRYVARLILQLTCEDSTTIAIDSKVSLPALVHAHTCRVGGRYCTLESSLLEQTKRSVVVVTSKRGVLMVGWVGPLSKPLLLGSPPPALQGRGGFTAARPQACRKASGCARYYKSPPSQTTQADWGGSDTSTRTIVNPPRLTTQAGGGGPRNGG